MNYKTSALQGSKAMQNLWLCKELEEAKREFEEFGNTQSFYIEMLDVLGCVAKFRLKPFFLKPELLAFIHLYSKEAMLYYNKWEMKQLTRGREPISRAELQLAATTIDSLIDEASRRLLAVVGPVNTAFML